jgi:ribonuclease P protein component
MPEHAMAQAASSRGLGRGERVRRRAEFERAYSSGVRIHARFMTLFVVANGGPHTRLGVAATRKLGSAVERNRVKRLSREVFRRYKEADGLDIVIVPRREMLDAAFADLEADYIAALGRRHTSRPAAKRDRRRRPPRIDSRL